MRRFNPATALLIIVCVGSLSAKTIQVPADQPTIQKAIDSAVDGDVIVVSPGTYTENIDFHGKAIKVQSARGPSRTIIDGGNVNTAVNFDSGEGSKSVLRGFTIQHGSASFGAGIMLLGTSPTIIGNVFRNNAQGSGGFGAAIGGNGSSPVVERNIFRNNSCDGQFLSGVVSFVNSSSPVIINNLFLSNPCRAVNMTLPEGNTPVIANNTIVKNAVGVRVDARVMTSTQLYSNNVIFGNQIGLEVDFLNSGNEPTWTNNLVFHNGSDYSGIDDETGQNGNISADPLFVDFADRNLRLQPSSPAIDAGTRAVPHLPRTDLDGNPRVVDGNGDGTVLPDIGAYEFIP